MLDAPPSPSTDSGLRSGELVTILPRWIWLPFAVGLAVFLVPLAGMLWRVPWSQVGELLASAPARQALMLSLGTCVLATGICVLLGVPLAIVLAKSSRAWVGMVRTLLTVPMVLPPVVAGLALLVTLGRRGPVGGWLSQAGIELGFTSAAVVIAQVFVSMPYLVIALEGALRTSGEGYERVAANLGASPSRVLWRVTLPMSLPAVVSGAALAFARSLGEFGATLTFAGSLPGVTRTLPLEIYLVRESDSDLALALALVLIVLAVAVIAISTRLRGARD